MTVENKVEELLRKNLSSRDSDHELFLAWAYYLEDMTEEEKQAFDVFKKVIRRMPALETITRARRDLQKENPYLRGQKYNDRQTREKQVRSFYRHK
jgi:ferritin